MRRIGIFGGIGSGKSTVSGYLAREGYTVLDADALNHALMEPGRSLYDAICDEFGAGVLNEEKQIDRKKLGALIFNNPAQKKKLDRIAHPIIYRALAQQADKMEKAFKSGTKETQLEGGLLFFDIPLLYETRDLAECLHLDSKWVITVDLPTQLERVCKRDRCSAAQALARIEAQAPMEEKERWADVVLQNEERLDALYAQIDKAIVQEKKVAEGQ